MPTTLEKTRKKIAKKRGALGALHKGSRDSQRLHKAIVRDERLEKLAMVRRKQEQPMVNRASFFQEIIQNGHNGVLTPEEIEAGISGFVHQFDDEMATLQLSRRSGRPASTREDLLKIKMASLEREFQNGFLLPDLTDKDTVKLLGLWEGSWAQLNSFKWVRFAAGGASRPATFPPNKD